MIPNLKFSEKLQYLENHKILRGLTVPKGSPVFFYADCLGHSVLSAVIPIQHNQTLVMCNWLA